MKIFLFIIFLLIIVLINHTYHFSHFALIKGTLKKPEDYKFLDFVKAFFLGVRIPKPPITKHPSQFKKKFKEINIEFRDIKLSSWFIRGKSKNQIVVFFHGFALSKSQLLTEAIFFNKLGYSVLLVDFRGSGDSSEAYTTVGIDESEDVHEVFKFVDEKLKFKKILLFGHSMGSVAILRAIHFHQIKPAGIILQTPFESFLNTTRNRFRLLKLPSFPMAEILVLAGSVIYKSNLFQFNPEEFAKSVTAPALLIIGKYDNRVFLDDIKKIAGNLKTLTELLVLKNSFHDDLYLTDKSDWEKGIKKYLNNIK